MSIQSRTPAQAQVTALFERWQQDRDHRAREQLTEMFLPLARNLARRYIGAQEPIDDLVQVASLGLVKAIDRFDTSRGIAFSSYAVPTILGELRRYFRDTGWAVHVPRGAQERALVAEKTLRKLSTEAGHTPSVRDLAQYLEWEVSDVLDALEAGAAHHATSLDAPSRSNDDEDWSLVDSLGADDERLELVEARVSVEAVARDLPERERHVLRLRFIDDLTQSQIGAEIGVSQMQVSRILRSALTRLHDLTAQPEAATPAAVGLEGPG
ncbi:MAG: SigB/SigF/SigG family RNA polymerase sigma factor [Actinomycetota bacterium]|nr:SigB/SigF/SigG family RNA polymerase sigma factor [Actinomycetota bacterium]